MHTHPKGPSHRPPESQNHLHRYHEPKATASPIGNRPQQTTLAKSATAPASPGGTATNPVRGPANSAELDRSDRTPISWKYPWQKPNIRYFEIPPWIPPKRKDTKTMSPTSPQIKPKTNHTKGCKSSSTLGQGRPPQKTPDQRGHNSRPTAPTGTTPTPPESPQPGHPKNAPFATLRSTVPIHGMTPKNRPHLPRVNIQRASS